jgi:membrane-associated phospholipid phosphatase
LLADQARLRAGGLLAGCAILVVVLGVLFAGQGTPDPFDRAVDGPFVTWFAGRQNLAAWLAYPATLVPAGGASLIAALACLARGWLRGAVLALLAVPVTSGLNDAFLKHLFHRTYLGALTYPSGHAAAASALAMSLTVLLLLAPRAAPSTRPAAGLATRPAAGLATRPAAGPAAPAGTATAPAGLVTALRWAVSAVAWLAVAVVAVGVMGLRWHYFTDTVGGAALGTGTVCALALILDLSWPRPGRGRPLPDASRSPRTGPRAGSAPNGRRWSRSGPGTS